MEVGNIPPVEVCTGRWVGIDLNTTGHIAVLADPVSGYTAKLGPEVPVIHHRFEMERKNLKKNSFRWKRIDRRETEQLKEQNMQISREIVRIARELRCGIKFEIISGKKHERCRKTGGVSSVFSINDWYFDHLCLMVENRACRVGLPVIYVSPFLTSQRCSRCGNMGIRHRKRFSCPACGFTGHADVNAAMNIAGAPVKLRIDEEKQKKEEIRRLARYERKRIRQAIPAHDSGSQEFLPVVGDSFVFIFGSSTG